MLDAQFLAALRAIGADIKALFMRTALIRTTTAAQSNTTTTLAAVTGLSAPMVANATYRVTGRVIFQSSALLLGATIGFAGPAGSAALLIVGVPTTSGTATNTATARFASASGSVSTSSVAAIATSLIATVDGIVAVGQTAGSFALQFSASAVLGTITVQPGSTLVVERLA